MPDASISVFCRLLMSAKRRFSAEQTIIVKISYFTVCSPDLNVYFAPFPIFFSFLLQANVLK